jgi:hypothetical protein
MTKTPTTKTWKTKYGSRRVRQDPPTLEEAIFAAQGLTDDPAAQVTIAASLMEVPVEQVKAQMAKSRPIRKDTSRIAFTGSGGYERAVLVERKPSRRIIGSKSVN